MLRSWLLLLLLLLLLLWCCATPYSALLDPARGLCECDLLHCWEAGSRESMVMDTLRYAP